MKHAGPSGNHEKNIVYYEEVARAMRRLNWDFLLGALWAGCLVDLCCSVYKKGKRAGRAEAWHEALDIVKDSMIESMESSNTDKEEEI